MEAIIAISIFFVACIASFTIGKKYIAFKFNERQERASKEKAQKIIDISDKFARLRAKLHASTPINNDKSSKA